MNKESTKPIVVLSLLWAAVAFFTLYGATQIRDELGWPSLEKALTQLASTADSIGLSNVHHGLEAVRVRINEDYLVLATEVEPDAPPIAKVPDGAHRAATPKRRVLVIGASSIQFALGVELEHFLPQYEGVKAKRFGKLATGLSRPDFFDWPKKLDELAKRFKPDLVIANYGGNCAQDIPVGDEMVKYENAEAWDPLYGQRVKDLVAVAHQHGADFVFIGMPNMKDPKFAKKMERLNRVQRQAAEEAGALWISVWEMTSTAKGGYRKQIHYENERGLMRAIDGVHYRTLGARYIVEQTMQEVERRFLLMPGDPQLARAEPHQFESKQTTGSISYTAFIPKSASNENRLPVAYTVPGHVSKWSEWPNHPHRQLQRLATQHSLVIVVLDSVTPKLFAKEIAPDVEKNLPVSDRRGLVGPDLSEVHVALEQLGLAHTYKEADAEAFRRTLPELMSWHAEQLRTPVTRR